ncbi:MAG: hypothetical protein ACTSP4_00450, partial [Candidatus Hodarchaeales archaeon]
MSEIILPTFDARPYQKEWLRAFFVEKYKNMVLIVHRRAGKDLFCINLIAAEAQLRVGTYLYLLPEQAHAKRIIWDGITGQGKRFLDFFPRDVIRRVNKSDMIIEFKNGSIFRLGGSDQIDKQVGTNPVMIIFGEYSLQKPGAWDYLRPILVENGGKAVFQFTPRSYNHAHDLYMMALQNPKWYVSKLDITQTTKNDGSPIITKEDIKEEIAQGFDEALINQEYYVSFEGPNTGSYYGKILTEINEVNHIKDFDINRDYPVNTVWDIGVNHPTTIWFWQYYGGYYHIIHSYDNIDEGLEHYYLYLHEYSRKYNLKFANHYAPHDIAVKEWGSGKTRIQQAYALSLYFINVPRLSVKDGIANARKILRKCVFHKTNCKRGLEALRAYKREWNDGRKCYVDHPLDDWSADYADAFRYLAISVREPLDKSNGP